MTIPPEGHRGGSVECRSGGEQHHADPGPDQPHLPRQGGRAAGGVRPLADNLAEALAEYTAEDQHTKPVGRDVSEAEALARALVGQVRPGEKAPPTVAERCRMLAGQLTRAWALAAGSENLADIKVDVHFYEEVRIWMAKFDAAERAASGRPVPEEVARLLRQIVDESTAAGEVVDIYQAAQISRPNFDHLSPEPLAQAKSSSRSQLAIEALRNSIPAEAERVTGHNLVRQRNFSERLASLMTRYTNS